MPSRPYVASAAFWHFAAVTPADPVAEADRRTSLADARAGICLAAGANPAEVDPGTGHNLSRHAYETARASWLAHIQHHGLTAHRRLRLDQARDRWAARRPRFVAGNDWAARASALHRKYQASVVRSARRRLAVPP